MTDLEEVLSLVAGRLEPLRLLASGEGPPLGTSERNAIFIFRFLLGVNPLAVEWQGLMVSTAHGDIGGHVLRERRADYFDANVQMSSGLVDALDHALDLWRGKEGTTPVHVLDAIGRFREGTLLAMASLQAPQAGGRPVFVQRVPAAPFGAMRTRKLPHMKDSEQTTIKDLHAMHYNTLYSRLASRAVGLHMLLARIIEPREKEIGQVARVKRYRKRKRRRVVAVIPIEIFEDDLALLERFDYLSVPAKEGSKEPDFADEWVTPEAIGDAVQAFLLHAFLTHTEAPSYPWAERIKRQRQRIRALTELNLGEAQDEEQDTSQK